MRSSLIGRCVLLSIAAAVVAQAQIPFQLLVTQGNNAITIQNGAGLTFNAPVGQTGTARVTATYSGTGQVTISQQPLVIGSTAFKADLTTAPPVTLNPGSSISFNIQFSPANATSSNAQLSLLYVETVQPSGGGSTPTITSGAINLSLTGTAPSFVLSYVLQSDQNVVPLQPGGTVVVPATLINTTAQVALNLTNVGSGLGTVTGITFTGSAFRVAGLPLFPASVASGQNLQVLILYQPTVVGSDTGQVQITFDSGSPVTISLQGTGSSPNFVYQILQTTPPTTVEPSGTIPLPDTNVGESSTVALRVLNTGNASGTISSIALVGQAFQLTNVPVLPRTLAPNATLTFSVTFTPSQPGSLTGSLIINSDILNLSGTGLGSLLEFSYESAGTTITLSTTNNSVVFSPVMITQSAQLSFVVRNTGTQAAVISNIGIGQTNSPFSLSGLLSLPVSLAPGADLRFTITFTPTALGFASGVLQLDTRTVNLIGSGTQPPPLPDYVIAGPSGTASPHSQAAVSLTLANSYPVTISGTLTLSVAGDLPADPAVQFATGGRTVSFVIPANSTVAVFGSQGSQIGLQTGTVAATITLTPSFATQAGGVDLTPETPLILQFAVAPAAPTLIALQLTDQTSTGFSITVTGFTTTRTLTVWNVQFTTASGFNMPTSQFAIDVRQIATVWFQSAASQAFGGQFTMTVPFTFEGTVLAGQSLLSSIASVSVTMSNELGASNSLQAELQ